VVKESSKEELGERGKAAPHPSLPTLNYLNLIPSLYSVADMVIGGLWDEIAGTTASGVNIGSQLTCDDQPGHCARRRHDSPGTWGAGLREEPKQTIKHPAHHLAGGRRGHYCTDAPVF